MNILVLMVCISFVLECVIALVWLAVKKVKEKLSYLTVYFMIPILGFSELGAISFNRDIDKGMLGTMCGIIAITYAVFFGISILVLGKKLHGGGYEHGKNGAE